MVVLWRRKKIIFSPYTCECNSLNDMLRSTKEAMITAPEENTVSGSWQMIFFIRISDNVKMQ